MRARVKMSGLVVHTTPDGKSYSSGRNRCERKLKRLEKLLEEGYKIANVKKTETSNSSEFKLFGTFTIEVPVEILIKAGFRK